MSNAITHVEFTIADHKANGFANIGTITFDDPEAGERFWSGLDVDGTQDTKTDDFNLIADLFCGSDNQTDEKLVSRDTIEAAMGGSIEQYIRDRQRLVDAANGVLARSKVVGCPTDQ